MRDVLVGISGWQEERTKRYRLFSDALVAGSDGEILELLERYLAAFNSTERPHAFLEIAPRLRPELIWRALHIHWQSFDKIPHRPFASILLRFRPYWRVHFLEQSEADAFTRLSQTVTIFRGQSADSAAGLSWSLSRATAESFARGHRGIAVSNPVIIQARASKSDIAGFYLGRDEDEIVLFSATSAKERRVESWTPDP